MEDRLVRAVRRRWQGSCHLTTWTRPLLFLVSAHPSAPAVFFQSPLSTWHTSIHPSRPTSTITPFLPWYLIVPQAFLHSCARAPMELPCGQQYMTCLPLLCEVSGHGQNQASWVYTQLCPLWLLYASVSSFGRWGWEKHLLAGLGECRHWTCRQPLALASPENLLAEPTVGTTPTPRVARTKTSDNNKH